MRFEDEAVRLTKCHGLLTLGIVPTKTLPGPNHSQVLTSDSISRPLFCFKRVVHVISRSHGVAVQNRGRRRADGSALPSLRVATRRELAGRELRPFELAQCFPGLLARRRCKICKLPEHEHETRYGDLEGLWQLERATTMFGDIEYACETIT